MREFHVTDNQNVTYTYQASDMRMALAVHHQMRGTDPIRAELVYADEAG